jgi:cyclopropane fatty-acyl-phospholipid synthase-like methyltransferase
MPNLDVMKDRGVEPAKELSLQILAGITQGRGLKRVNVRLWDDTWWPDNRPHAATLVLNRPSSLKEMLLPGTEAGVGEAYIHSAFDIEGDFEAAFEVADILVEETDGWSKKLKLGYLLHRLPDADKGSGGFQPARLTGREHSTRRDREAIGFHYDVSNHFYQLWLDSRMIYSCAYFMDRGEDLEHAQVNKLHHICRKLGLRSGQRLLDIGCGWGGLICHAAHVYGAQCHGVTLSQAQFDFTSAKIERMGLGNLIKLELRDYRSIDVAEGYDKISQVEMFEHVGLDNHDMHFEQVRKLLRPRGLYLHQASTRWATPDLSKFRKPTRYQKVITQFIFPGGELDYIGLTATNLERHGFEIHDVEGLREHFQLTLEHWVERLYKNQDAAFAEIGRKKTRMWLLYFALFGRAFERGTIGVFQTLASKRAVGGAGLPLKRVA